MFQSLFPVLSFVIYATSCNAGLYPTRPVANTVFHGGRWNDVMWKDTTSSPRLQELGKLNIDLWLGDIIHLARLSKDVDPMMMKQSVFIPSGLWTNATNYVMQFNSEGHPTIYTAYFSIDDMTGERTSHVDQNLAQALASSSAVGPSSSSAASASVNQNILPGGGKNDLVTVTMTSSDAANVPFPEPTNAGPVGAMANEASSGGRHVRKRSMHFNFVFVLFPALFGLALAL